MEKVNRCFFAFIYLFIMFYSFQCSWLSILLMGSIALACFLCWVRIFNIICYILLYITLEVLMTFKCNFVTCNILFHFNSVDDWPNLSNWMVLNQVWKKISYYASTVIGQLTFVNRNLLLIGVYEFNVMNLKCREL